MEKTDWQKWAAIIFCAAAAILAGWLFVKYLLGIFIPFLVAWGVALLVVPAAGWVSKKTKIPQKLCSFVLLLAVLAIITIILTLVTNRLIYELKQLVGRILSGEGGLGESMKRIAGWFQNIEEKIPFLRDLRGQGGFESFVENLNNLLVKFLTDLISNLSAILPSVIFRTVAKLPGALLILIVTVVACFYFCMDLQSIHASLLLLLPNKAADYMPTLKSKVFDAAGKWLKAYLILFGITFAGLFVGLMILGVEYPLFIALLGALVDILPVLGVGTVLVPWGLYELITKDFELGFGLLILYAVMVIVRQVAEPRVVGDSFGIHPLAALVAMYAGLRLFGLAGMILLPAFVMLVFSIIKPKEPAGKKPGS
ncbi:MAG: sporulation integral membrane protein YtvI [Clostridiales bacterium]|jgi:sporulation integral membrane protein YtvI|nr:sporulation integral membrane protein YtvI [Clostridiales bacterium]